MEAEMSKNYLRREDLKRKLGNVADSTMYLWIKKGLLPKPRHLGRTSFWDEDEVDAAFERMRQADTAA